MKGKIFKIKNMEDELVLPITTTEAVYSEDGKTLNDEINDINSSLETLEDEKATKQEVDVERKRIDNINSSLDNIESKKLDKNGIISMTNMGQDVKEAMTGGSVAVVGKNAVLTENIVDNQITVDKLNDTLLSKIADYITYNLTFKIGGINSNGTENTTQTDRCTCNEFLKVDFDYTIISPFSIHIHLYKSPYMTTSSFIRKESINANTEYKFDGEYYLKIMYVKTDTSLGEQIKITSLKQLDIRNDSVTIPKLSSDVVNFINNKVSILELNKYKDYIDNLFLMNGLNINEVDIPDEYNTGANKKNISQITDSNEFIANGVSFVFGGENQYYSITYNSNKYLNGEYILENIQFTKQLRIINGNMFTNDVTLTFNNCIFEHFIGGTFENEKIKIIFNNCTFNNNVSGSNITLNNCKLLTKNWNDNSNPLANAYYNNCLIKFNGYEGNETGLHFDNIQIYGKSTQEAKNIHFKNCRFVAIFLPNNKNSYVNACIMVQLEYNNGSDISFEDCIVNGGGYTIYCHVKPNVADKYTLSNVRFKNIRCGCSHKWGGYVYPNHDKNATEWENVGYTNSLYIGSCFRDGENINISVTNDTNVERTLKVITNNGEYIFTIPKCLKYSEMVPDVTKLEDFPFDILKTIEDNSMWVRCYDITDGEVLIKSKVLM